MSRFVPSARQVTGPSVGRPTRAFTERPGAAAAPSNGCGYPGNRPAATQPPLKNPLQTGFAERWHVQLVTDEAAS